MWKDNERLWERLRGGGGGGASRDWEIEGDGGK